MLWPEKFATECIVEKMPNLIAQIFSISDIIEEK
jgi:hypothetical protein